MKKGLEVILFCFNITSLNVIVVSASISVISELITDGVKNRMWGLAWAPDGIKGSFVDYLREKARNIYKRRRVDEMTAELKDAFGQNSSD